MASDVDEAKDVSDFIASLKEIVKEEEEILNYTKSVLDEENGMMEFVDKKISRLFRLAFVYNNVFQRHSVKTKDEFEQLFKTYFRHSEVRELHDEVFENEEEWDSILKDVDDRLSANTNQALGNGDRAPLETKLIDARTGQTTCLSQYLQSGKHLILILLRHFA